MSVSFSIDSLLEGLLFPAALLLLAVLALAWVVKPWELKGGSLLDKLRVGEAVNNYDFWLSVRGVMGRRRRELRDELRANLWEAARRVGAKEAVRAVGPLRRLAAEAVADGARTGPRWVQGIFAGAIALELVLAAQFFAATIWADAALAAKVARLEGDIALIPGTHVAFAQESGGGFSVATSLGPACLVVGVLVLVLVAQPWRALARRGSYVSA